MAYLVRTVILQHYYKPAAEMAGHRRSTISDRQSVVSAMKRTELATQTLEKELNAFAEKGLEIVSIIPHPADPKNPYDLLITVVLSENE